MSVMAIGEVRDLHWVMPEYSCRLTRTHSHSTDFVVFERVATDMDSGAPLFTKAGATGCEDITESLDDAEVFMRGYIKWDGCVDFEFPSPMYHMCGLDDCEAIAEVWRMLYAAVAEAAADHFDRELAGL